MPVQTKHQSPVSNEDLAIKIDGLESRLGGRLDRLEKIVIEAGLNGHSSLLKSFLEQYAATDTQRQAWLTVRQDISHRFRFLSSPKAWVKALLYAAIGGLGWKLVSQIPFPHI